MKVKAVEISRRIKKARQEGRAFLSYIGKPEEEENLPSEYVYCLYDKFTSYM
jgi:predicted TPR repeat methyltransferase